MRDWSSDKDYQLVQRVLSGERRAFEQLIERHKSRSMALAQRMLKNREDAEEALQDAFIRVYKSLHKFEWKSSFSTWLYKIVFNVCSSKLQKSDREILTRNTVSLENSGAMDFHHDEPAPDITCEQGEFEQFVREEMEKLPLIYSTILTMVVVQELSYEEITEITRLPLGTVKNRLFRARAMLKESLSRRLREHSERFFS